MAALKLGNWETGKLGKRGKGKWEWGVSKRVKGNENGQKGDGDGDWPKEECEMGIGGKLIKGNGRKGQELGIGK
jgi:hypothetical protein